MKKDLYHGMRQIFTIFAISMDKIKKLISILSEQAEDKSKGQMKLFVTSDKIDLFQFSSP